DDAINAFTKLLSLENTPSDTRRAAEAQLADIYLRTHRYEDAERHVDAILSEQSPSKAMRFNAAVILGACTKLDRSLELLDDLLEEDEQDGAVLEKKAWVLWLLHRYEDAARVARAALAVMPENELCLRRLVDYESLAGNR